MKSFVLVVTLLVLSAGSVFGSGFGVFTQGASALGQANAVVAHPTGPSSVYFNPALLNDVAGRQIEVGATGIFADRSIELNSGAREESQDGWNFPPTVYYSQQINERLSAGLGIFSPFGLSTEWDSNYAGRYLGTYGEMTSVNINPVLSYRLSDKLSVAGGVSLVYLSATLEKKINQTAAYILTDIALGGGVLPALAGPLVDIDQRFKGDGWGAGFNLGLLYKANEQLSFGATYRSHVDIEVDGKATFSQVSPLLDGAFPNTNGQAKLRLPAQATAGVAVSPVDRLVVEAGVRWEDWSSSEQLRVDLASPVFGQSADIVPRDWKSTWSYNLGGQYQLSETLALNAGYLFGENAVPSSTFEPLVPDSDAHLFTVGVEWQTGPWTFSSAFGYERHDRRNKSNSLGDPLGSLLAGNPSGTANGAYDADIYLTGVSLAYRF